MFLMSVSMHYIILHYMIFIDNNLAWKRETIPELIYILFYTYLFYFSHFLFLPCPPFSYFSYQSLPALWPWCRFHHTTWHDHPTSSPLVRELDSWLFLRNQSMEDDSCTVRCIATSAVCSCQPQHESRDRSARIKHDFLKVFISVKFILMSLSTEHKKCMYVKPLVKFLQRRLYNINT